MLTKTACLLLWLGALFGCSHDIDDYRQTSPSLDIKAYFSGDLIAWGMVQNYADNVIRRFCVEINGQWQGDTGVLAEVFYFSDGEISTRNWTLTQLANNQYQGEAEDVVGLATGKQQGFAFHWQYDLSVPIDNQVYLFSMDDWMYRLDEYRVFNRTKMKKLGIEVAEITLFFDKRPAVNACR